MSLCFHFEGGGENFSEVKRSVRQCIDHTETVILRLSYYLLVWVVQNNSNFFQDALQQNSNILAGIFTLAHGLLKSTQETWMSELFWASCTVLMLKTRPNFCSRQTIAGVVNNSEVVGRGKDKCSIQLTGIEREYWMGTEISRFGCYGFRGTVTAGDGSNQKVGEMGAGYVNLRDAKRKDPAQTVRN